MFWEGFVKRGEMLSKFDAQGGVAPRAMEEMAAAQAVDLLTLPKTTQGANCANCRYMKMLDKKSERGMCQNPNVMQEVTGRMHCSQWDAPGAVRNYEPQMPVVTPSDMQAADMEQQALAEQAAMMPEAEMGEEGAAPVEGAAAPAKEKKPAKKKEKKSDVSKGPSDAKHTINIHVGAGGKKTEK